MDAAAHGMATTRKLYRHDQLSRLLDPASIAIVGASPRPGSFGQRVAHSLEHYAGRLWQINPRYDRIDEARCYPSLAALPEVPDCIVIVSPADSVEPTVAEAVALGVGGVVIFAGGFAETGKPENILRQQRLTDMVRGTATRLVGPNCIGVINYISNARIAFSPMPPKTVPGEAAIAIVSQSGAIGVAIAQAIEHGTSVTHTLTAGNGCDVDPSDFIAYLAEDPRCKAIACVFEGLSDIDRFLEAADCAWRADKPLVVYKMAVCERGAAAALSHTGSLAGTDAAYRAAFDRAGVIQVEALEDLIETASFFAKAPRIPAGPGVGILSTTGGGAIIAVDKAEAHGVLVPQFTAETEAFLTSVLPDYGSPRNPCDTTAQALNDPDGLRKCGEAIFAEAGVGTLLLPHPLARDAATSRLVMLGDVGARFGKPLCTVWLPGWLEGPGAREAEEHPNVALFRSTDRCMAAIAHWHRRSAKRAEARTAGRLTAASLKSEVRCLLARQGAMVVGESDAKAILARYGVPVPAERLVGTIEEARDAIAAIGLPLVMKIESPDIPHKTEAGMVKLDLGTAAAAEAAFHDIMARAAAMPTRPRVRGVVVQPMIHQGLELVVGGRIDPLFGPMVVFGFGGVLVELLGDSVTALAPVTPADVRGLLPRLRGYALLDGFRGSAPVDLDALCRIVAGVSEFLADHAASIAELDINPLIATPTGLVAVDALIVRT